MGNISGKTSFKKVLKKTEDVSSAKLEEQPKETFKVENKIELDIVNIDDDKETLIKHEEGPSESENKLLIPPTMVNKIDSDKIATSENNRVSDSDIIAYRSKKNESKKIKRKLDDKHGPSLKKFRKDSLEASENEKSDDAKSYSEKDEEKAITREKFKASNHLRCNA